MCIAAKTVGRELKPGYDAVIFCKAYDLIRPWTRGARDGRQGGPAQLNGIAHLEPDARFGEGNVLGGAAQIRRRCVPTAPWPTWTSQRIASASDKVTPRGARADAFAKTP
jgi:hypothetical protein